MHPLFIQFLIVLYYALTVYFYLIFINIIFSWIPELKRTKFGQLLERIVSPFMSIFRGLIVIGMLDFTPMVGILLYQVALNYLGKLINVLATL